MERIEFIESYRKVGDDYQWSDNHGELIRCKDCKFATITEGINGKEPEVKYCDIWFPRVSEYMPINYYCASAEKRSDTEAVSKQKEEV